MKGLTPFPDSCKSSLSSKPAKSTEIPVSDRTILELATTFVNEGSFTKTRLTALLKGLNVFESNKAAESCGDYTMNKFNAEVNKYRQNRNVIASFVAVRGSPQTPGLGGDDDDEEEEDIGST